MKALIFTFTLLFTQIHALDSTLFEDRTEGNQIVLESKRVFIEGFPEAFNPSLFKIDQGYLLTFRYTLDQINASWVNYIGVILLSETFEPISKPQLLSTRSKNSKTPSQTEDARVFSYRNRLFLIYNDNPEVTNPHRGERRDMYIAELIYREGLFSLSTPLKLYYEDKYNTAWWQKNWSPFEWNHKLFLSYTISPHEIIYLNLTNGDCYKFYETQSKIDWEWGPLRGGTPPLLVDGEYLTFFHSGMMASSPVSFGWDLWHYFMGVYTFSADPPFQITKISRRPIIADGFYEASHYQKRVIFPGGFVVADEKIYLAYGRDDYEVWIATIDKAALLKSLVSVEKQTETNTK